MSGQPLADASVKTYYLKLPYRLVAVLIIALGIVPGLFILPSFSNRDFSADQIGTYVFALVMFVALFDLFLWIGYLLLRIRLVVSSQGVVFKAVGYTVRSSWANVASLDTMSTTRGPQRGLILNQPGLEVGGCLSSLLTLLPGLLLMNMLRGRPTASTSIDNRFIPIGPFESDRLVAEIQRYAPQLTNAPDHRSDVSPNEPAPDAAPADRVNWLSRSILVIGVAVIEIAFVVLSVQAWQGDVAPIATLNVGAWPVGLTFTRDSQTLLVAMNNGQLQAWRVSDGTLQQTRQLTGELASFTLSADGQTMAAGIQDGTVQVRHSDGTIWKSMGKVEHVPCPPCASYPPVAFSPDDQNIASGSRDGTIHVWRLSDGHELLALKASSDSNEETITGVAFSPDGQMLAASAESLKNTVQIWRLDTGSLLGAFPGQNFSGQTFANNLTFASDGKLLAVSTLDQGVWLIRPEDRGRSGILSVANSAGRIDEWMAAFSPDNQYVASVTNGGTLQIWRLSDYKLLRTLRAHADQIRQVAFSPDGRYLATGSFDNTVRLWRAADVTK